MTSVENLAILVPLKGFATAKSRLRQGGVEGVDDLARSLADRVLAACRPHPVFVVCESPDVADFAHARGAGVIESSSTGLNAAVTHAYHFLSLRFSTIIVAHGDLRHPAGLGQFEPAPGITIVTDDLRVGTNVLALPSGLEFTFLFGPNSAHAHQREAQRLGLEVRMEFDSPWRFDIDEPHDVAD